MSTTGATLRSRSRGELPQGVLGAALVLPAVALTVALLAYPVVYSFWMSLHAVRIGEPTWAFVGLDNYRTIIGGSDFGPILSRTLVFSSGITVATLALGMACALLLNEPFRGRGLVRGLLILPWSMSQTMLALMFGWMFNSTYGPINALLRLTGLIDQYIAWFADGRVALAIIGVGLVWNLVPFATLLLLGSLQTVPDELLKAATVDGAGTTRRFWLVTLPWITPTALIVVILAALNAFLAFAPIYILTGGGPGTDTTVLSWFGYQRGFRTLDLGESAAIFYLLSLLVLLVSGATVAALVRERGGERYA